MTHRQQRSGAPPPRERPAPEGSSHRHSAGQPDGSAYPHHGEQVRAVPDVPGFAAPPAGRRTRWAIVVPACVHCGSLHLHRSAGEYDGIRTGSCGKPYRVVLAGSKRRLWAS